jgi:hypothetical protein
LKSSIYDNFTNDELERIECFKNAGPCLREEMIRTNENIYWNTEDGEIRREI